VGSWAGRSCAASEAGSRHRGRLSEPDPAPPRPSRGVGGQTPGRSDGSRPLDRGRSPSRATVTRRFDALRPA